MTDNVVPIHSKQHLDPKYLPDGVTEYGSEGTCFESNPELGLPPGQKVKFTIHAGRITIYAVWAGSLDAIEVFACGPLGASDSRRGCRHRPGLTAMTAVTNDEWTEAIG